MQLSILYLTYSTLRFGLCCGRRHCNAQAPLTRYPFWGPSARHVRVAVVVVVATQYRHSPCMQVFVADFAGQVVTAERAIFYALNFDLQPYLVHDHIMELCERSLGEEFCGSYEGRNLFRLAFETVTFGCALPDRGRPTPRSSAAAALHTSLVCTTAIGCIPRCTELLLSCCRTAAVVASAALQSVWKLSLPVVCIILSPPVFYRLAPPVFYPGYVY
jgi:hypothetical protein